MPKAAASQKNVKGRRDLPWFRLYSEAVDDEKLRLLAFEDRWHFIALLCCKSKGLLDSSDRLMSRKVAVKTGLTIEELGDVLVRLGAVGLVCTETLQPSMRLVVDRADLRPSQSAWTAIRDRIFRRDEYTCAYCSAKGVQLECDHVIPVARGGKHDDSNLVTACRKCNRSKRDKLLSEWRKA